MNGTNMPEIMNQIGEIADRIDNIKIGKEVEEYGTMATMDTKWVNTTKILKKVEDSDSSSQSGDSETESISSNDTEMNDQNTLGSPEIIIKHPLENAWTLWFFKNDRSRGWEENQRAITTVSTVEDFWALYNHIEVPSRLPMASHYSLFKEGVMPNWDDASNAPGGRWIISLETKHRAKFLDNHWMEVLFFLIGESADQHAHLVNGAVVNVGNKADRLAVWLSRAKEEDGVVTVGKMVKQKLGLKCKVSFKMHEEEKSGTGNRPRFYV